MWILVIVISLSTNMIFLNKRTFHFHFIGYFFIGKFIFFVNWLEEETYVDYVILWYRNRCCVFSGSAKQYTQNLWCGEVKMPLLNKLSLVANLSCINRQLKIRTLLGNELFHNFEHICVHIFCWKTNLRRPWVIWFYHKTARWIQSQNPRICCIFCQWYSC